MQQGKMWPAVKIQQVQIIYVNIFVPPVVIKDFSLLFALMTISSEKGEFLVGSMFLTSNNYKYITLNISNL